MLSDGVKHQSQRALIFCLQQKHMRNYKNIGPITNQGQRGRETDASSPSLWCCTRFCESQAITFVYCTGGGGSKTLLPMLKIDMYNKCCSFDWVIISFAKGLLEAIGNNHYVIFCIVRNRNQK